MNKMAVSPYISFLRPRIMSLIQQKCCLRNSLKIGKDQYELAVDVKHFCKDELKIKARRDRILIEGKHERKLDKGVIIREFSRKYMLPPGVDPKRIQSELRSDGILTIKAPRDIKDVVDEELLCETQVPIVIKGDSDAEAKAMESEEIKKPLDTPNEVK